MLMLFAAALVVASMIACRKLPAPASAVVVTVKVAAWTLGEANTSKLSSNVANAMLDIRIKDRIDSFSWSEARSFRMWFLRFRIASVCLSDRYLGRSHGKRDQRTGFVAVLQTSVFYQNTLKQQRWIVRLRLRLSSRLRNCF